ncbi:uncharacterized protein LAESUDRAFT_9403 [Laetiporus sulphureus 93-53]|uniref:Uncharacterized protein n=1 Tax=Laetiporus sulphureus 93-53 TaxID=1314785 RepID=A0A165I5R8_9APHY|nr:uncharacterized protein LAESUDRAFT_9403 [Laetiporus sulphureus 93-53]KZT12628.1 hypothetical protein LAESUDRAFT_9403 [Laetiporus sulphureus 93-53]
MTPRTPAGYRGGGIWNDRGRKGRAPSCRTEDECTRRHKTEGNYYLDPVFIPRTTHVDRQDGEEREHEGKEGNCIMKKRGNKRHIPRFESALNDLRFANIFATGLLESVCQRPWNDWRRNSPGLCFVKSAEKRSTSSNPRIMPHQVVTKPLKL